MLFRLFPTSIVLLFLSIAAPAEQFVLTPDSDYYGFDLRAEPEMTLEQCQMECLADPACRAFTHNGRNGHCFLKSDHGPLQPFVGATAGRLADNDAMTDLGAPPPLTFLPDYVHDEAISYRADLLRAETRDPTTDSAQPELLARQALAAGNPVGAIGHFRTALAIAPETSSAWSGLSEAARTASGQQGVDNWQMQITAGAAAVNAYQTSRHARERAEALRQLGLALEWRQMYRPAITAYAASLALHENPALRAQYEDLRQRQGFRIVDHTIDSDSRTPRACVQFSEPLVKSGVDYADFVTLDGRAAQNVTTGEREICVEGLSHGERYRLELRAGLPSSIGEAISGPVGLDVYIRDRTPFVRFTGDNFVLPAAGRHGIPLVTVNADKVELAIYRIGDRALADIVGNSRFLRQLTGYALMSLAEESGERVWQGVMETDLDQNREVVTSLPLDEALPRRQPGVYVLAARVGEAAVDDWEAQATQWFVVSDIGLTSFSGEDGIRVEARSLARAEPLQGISLQLIARNNEVLGEALTDADGLAHFPAGLARGTGGMAPQLVVARDDMQGFVFLDLARAGFDFSDRGVEGRPAPGGIDVMVWTERGIYRAGEEVHVTALSRDAAANAIDNLPLTFIFSRPDGVEFRRMVSVEPRLGGHSLVLPLPDNAMRGAWNLAVHEDPERPPLATKPFLVEDFIPDRIEFELATADTSLAPGVPLSVEVSGNFLYGAPASGLAMEGEVLIRPTQDWDAHPGYRFGLADERDDAAMRLPLVQLPVLDASGKAEVQVQVDNLPSTTRLLAAAIHLRLRESGGRAVEREISIPIRPQGPVIGIAPSFIGDAVPEDSHAGFRIIAVGPDGERIDLPGASWSLVRIERNFQWYRQESGWNYEAVDYTTLIDDGEIDLTADQPAQLALPVGWGRYRLEVATPDGHGISSVEFNAGWFVESRSTDTPDGLEMALDREVYDVGDVARLHVSPRHAGKLVVIAGTEEVLDRFTADIPETGATIDIPVGAHWGAGTYLTATLYRPSSEEGSRVPMRAIGVKWLGIAPGERSLEVELQAPDRAKPQARLEIPVAVKGAGIGERAYVTLAAVDVGILNLTRYEAPDPAGWYFGQRRLGLQMRDIYGRLIDGSAGAPGRLRTGGDGPAMTREGSPPTEKLVAFHSGIVELDENGEAVIGFDLPQFNGTVRLMAVAWTASGLGHASKDVIVRDPVVITASMPRFLAPGDAADMHLELALADAPAGAYRLNVAAMGAADAEFGTRNIQLSEQGRSEVRARLKGIVPGMARIRILLEGEGDLRLEQVHELPVRPATLPIANRMEIEVAARGGSLRLDQELLDGSHADDASVTLSIAPAQAIDIPAVLMSLDRYPYGCAEQVASRALPLLYAAQLAENAGLEAIAGTEDRVRDAIARVLSNQSPAGSFGLWSPGSGDLWLDAYITDFLTRAREQGYEVPELAMRSALDNLQNTLAYTDDVEAEGPAIAYAIHVLARNRRASAGDLRYLSDMRIDAFATPMSRAQIGASLALYGDSRRAEAAFASALQLAEQGGGVGPHRADYGSDLRDNAALLALAAESRQVRPAMTRLVADSLLGRRNTSTQEQAWMLLAARALESSDSTIELAINGKEHSGSYARRLEGSKLAEHPLVITNLADSPVTAVVTTIAAPEYPLPAGGNGFHIERNYYSLAGELVSLAQVRQNERYVAVLRIVEENAWPSRLLVTDLLPAGVEIDNPALVSSAGLAGFDWLPETEPAHLEFRDDRFVAAFERDADSSREIMLAYVVRAVTPGEYAHPAATVEDMYRPHFAARTATGYMTVVGP